MSTVLPHVKATDDTDSTSDDVETRWQVLESAPQIARSAVDVY